MRSNLNFIPLFFIVFILYGCKKEEPVDIIPTVQLSEDNYLIFGSFFWLM